MTGKAQSPQKKNIGITIISIVLVMCAFMGLFLNKILSPRILGENELRANGVMIFPNPRELKALSLISDEGVEFKNSDLEGKLNVMFFGFTHCPDICPTALGDLAYAYNHMDTSLREHIQLNLVSLDPARDTPEILKQYVDYFDESIVAVTGEFPKIMSFTQNVNVAFSKVKQGESYTIDHTSHFVLVDQFGNYVGFIKFPISRGMLVPILNTLAYGAS